MAIPTRSKTLFTTDLEIVDNHGETREVSVAAEIVYTYWPYVPQTWTEPAEGGCDEIHSITIKSITDNDTGHEIGWVRDSKSLIEKIEKAFDERSGEM